MDMYYFTEEISGDDVIFPFIIQKGFFKGLPDTELHPGIYDEGPDEDAMPDTEASFE